MLGELVLEVAQQRRFDRFQRIYNEQRPHEALGDQTPASCYRPSTRRYSGRLRSPDYGDAYQVRRVRRSGEIKWRGRLVFVSEVLAGEPVDPARTQAVGCFVPDLP